MLNHPAAKKGNLFKINKNKKYVLQHKIVDNRIKSILIPIHSIRMQLYFLKSTD